MTSYSKNITGSPSYWLWRRTELEALFQQAKIGTVFFTFSFADRHWPDLHRLFPGGWNEDMKIRDQNINNNPHLVDWFFSFKLNEFLRTIFDQIFETEWRWYRLEWQYRLSIHAHGAARLKNDPGLIDLCLKVFKGIY
jgi:hypothetical protein